MWRGICQLNLTSSDTCERFAWFFPSQQETEVGGLSVSVTKPKIKYTVLKKSCGTT